MVKESCGAFDQDSVAMIQTHDPVPAPPMPQMFGNAGREHMAK